MMDCQSMQQQSLSLADPFTGVSAQQIVQTVWVEYLAESWRVDHHRSAPTAGGGIYAVKYIVELNPDISHWSDDGRDFFFIEVSPLIANDAEAVELRALGSISAYLAGAEGCCHYWLRNPETFPFGALPEPGESGGTMLELLRYYHEYQRQKQEDPS